jgi:hypothetical protein
VPLGADSAPNNEVVYPSTTTPTPSALAPDSSPGAHVTPAAPMSRVDPLAHDCSPASTRLQASHAIVPTHEPYNSSANDSSSSTALIPVVDPASNATATTAPAPALPQDQLQVVAPMTRLQAGIHKPKMYTEDTVRYSLLVASVEPTDMSLALSDPNWKHAMDSEYVALMHNQTWHLVPPALGHNLIDCK